MSPQKARRTVPIKTRSASVRKSAHRRLEHLYEISKHLAAFENVEQSFPKILSLAAGTFPLTSAVLIENRGSIPKTSIWPTTGLSETHIKKTLSRARNAYSTLAGSTPFQSAELRESSATKMRMRGKEFSSQTTDATQYTFLTLPIVLDRRSVFGVLQFETSELLNEEDLAFVDALTNLIAVALDRHYRANDERELQKAETNKRIRQLRETQAVAKASAVVLVKRQERISDLEEEQTLREKFVSTLSHDLRTPLTAAKMSAQLISRIPGTTENKLLADRIVSDIDRVDQMIKDLLDANRIRAGEQLRLDVSHCDLHAVVANTIGMLQGIHGDRFIINTDQREIWGYWSIDGLRRVVENLANNAVKYGSSNRPITITLKQSKQRVQLMVHNEGDPIPQRDQVGLFQQFKRANSAQTGKKKGWGLGLSIVHSVVEAHGGKVAIESSAGRGTTFTVELPNDSRPFQAAPVEPASA